MKLEREPDSDEIEEMEEEVEEYAVTDPPFVFKLTAGISGQTCFA